MEKRIRFLQNFCFWAVIVLLVFCTLKFAVPLIWPFLGGLALAYLFKHISRRLKIRGGAPVAVIAVLFYALVILAFWGIAVFTVERIIGAAQSFPVFFRDSLLPALQSLGDQTVEWLQALAPAFALSLSEIFDVLSSAMTDVVSSLSSWLISTVTGAVKGFPMFLIGFVFMIVSSFYICMDYTRITGFLMRQIPKRAQPLILDIKNFLTSCLFRLVRAYLIIMIVTFAELSIGLSFLKIENALSIAALTAVLDILPLLGSGAILIPWALYHLIAGTAGTGVGLILLYAAITVIRNIIEPRIVGDQLGLHPVVTLSAMFIGLKVIGVWGIFLMPVAALLIRYLTTVEGIPLYKT